MNVDLFTSWNLIRISGFVSYFLITFSISAGLLSRLSFLQRHKALLMESHQVSGWIGFLITLFHMLMLLIDNYVPYQIWELFIPFGSSYHPVFSGFGTIALYFFFLTLLTSDFFIKKMGRQVWKKVHLLVIPSWILMVLHSILIGTDTEQPWASFMYGGSILLVISLMLLRYIEGRYIAMKMQNQKRY